MSDFISQRRVFVTFVGVTEIHDSVLSLFDEYALESISWELILVDDSMGIGPDSEGKRFYLGFTYVAARWDIRGQCFRAFRLQPCINCCEARQN